MRFLLASLIVVASVGCSTSSHGSSATTTRAVASTTTTIFMCRGCNLPRPYGTITGRYYTDGGPPPPPGATPTQSAHPIIGTITVTNAESHKMYRPRQDSHGYFTLIVPIGTYSVMAESRGGAAAAMTDTVTVTAGKTANADLGIHMP